MPPKPTKAKKVSVVIFLFLLSPVMGELLSGSAPPNEFFTPFGFVIMSVLYGGGCLLIREARVRWDLGWSVIFLAVAYGILEEGLLMHSFFNHHHIDLDVLTKYGMFLKCQWPWTIQLIIYHATISTLIPIMATDLLFPDMKNESLLSRGWIVGITVALVLETILISLMITTETAKMDDPYVPDWLNIFVWVLITVGLIYLAYKLKDKHYTETKAKIKRPFVFFINGLFFAPVLIITPYILANNNVHSLATIAFLVLYGLLVLRFGFRQMYNANVKAKHKVFLFAGVIVSFCLLALFNEYTRRVHIIRTTVCSVLKHVITVLLPLEIVSLLLTALPCTAIL